MSETQHTRLALKQIKPSPTQPRKHFDQRKLQELADSLGPPVAKDDKPAGRGVIVPVIVRRVNGHHELVAGERRLRASEIAGWPDIPVVVVDMTDGEVAEAQLLENSMRDDLTVIEEAEHYKLLIDKFKHTHDTLAAKTGKSRSHIYGRLALLKLGAIAKKALAEGKLAPAIATDLVVTVADPKLQEQYVRECLGDKLNYNERGELEALGIQHEGVGPLGDDGDPLGVEISEDAQPLSYRAARELLRRKYSTKLSLAKFDPTDATLTKAGACGPCPHRSGSQPELPGMAPSKTAADVCTKPSCFEEKTQAVWKIQTKGAEARGLKVVEREDAKNVFHDSGEIKPSSPYVDQNEAPPSNIAKPGSTASWAKLLGKKLAEIPRVLVQDVTGAPRELLDRKKAVEVLRADGKLDEPEKPKKSASSSSGSGSSSSSSSDDWKKEQEKRERESEQKKKALTSILEVVAAGAEDLPEKKELAFWRFVAKCCLRDTWDMQLTADRREVKHPNELPDLIDKAKSVGAIRGLVAECMIESLCDAYSKSDKELFADACKLLGADYDKALEQVKADAKETAKLEAAAAKEAAKKEEEKKDAKSDKPAKKVAAKKSPAKKKGGKK